MWHRRLLALAAEPSTEQRPFPLRAICERPLSFAPDARSGRAPIVSFAGCRALAFAYESERVPILSRRARTSSQAAALLNGVATAAHAGNASVSSARAAAMTQPLPCTPHR